jgi:hypothetical protein
LLKNRIRFLKHIALPIALVFLGLFQFSCRKTYSDPKVTDVFDSSPVETGYMELSISCFLPLPDNTFIISVKSTPGSFLDKEVFLHYDANFNLIDSTYWEAIAIRIII